MREALNKLNEYKEEVTIITDNNVLISDNKISEKKNK